MLWIEILAIWLEGGNVKDLLFAALNVLPGVIDDFVGILYG